MAVFIEVADGVDKIANLQMHDNAEIYQKSFSMIETYFGDEGDEDLEVAVDESGQFKFDNNHAEVPQGGFQFN